MGVGSAEVAAAQFVQSSAISKALFHPSSCNKLGGLLVVSAHAKEDGSSARMDDVFHGHVAEKCVSQD